MIRRKFVYAERDQRVVKWALIASAFALSIGTVAEIALERSELGTTVAGQSVPAQTSDSARSAG